MTINSRIPGFKDLTVEERRNKIGEMVGFTEDDKKLLSLETVPRDVLNRMIENVIGYFPSPLGVATNFKINEKDYLVPMVVEEASVVAAASNAARIARIKGGFYATTTDPVMIGQIQVLNVDTPFFAAQKILSEKERLLKKANDLDPVLVKFGGGAKDLEVRVIPSILEEMVVVHLLVDCRDAMGANAVNTMVEGIASDIEEITGGKVLLRIISNLADRRLVRARAVFDKDALGGEEVVDGILAAYAFADADPYRAATHNKGIMNGITSLVLATGNDTRAIEAGAHAYAARFGYYGSLTTYEKNKDGDLVGTIELPMALGTIGGATRAHPTAQLSLKILGVKTAVELAQVAASLGLAQNLAALRALATEGIQKGHMKLHARNIAASVGATGELIDKIAKKMVEDKKIRMDYAEELLKKFTGRN